MLGRVYSRNIINIITIITISTITNRIIPVTITPTRSISDTVIASRTIGGSSSPGSWCQGVISSSYGDWSTGGSQIGVGVPGI